MSKFIEHNSSGWNGSDRTLRISMFTNPKVQEMQKIFDLMASKSKPVK